MTASADPQQRWRAFDDAEIAMIHIGLLGGLGGSMCRVGEPGEALRIELETETHRRLALEIARVEASRTAT